MHGSVDPGRKVDSDTGSADVDGEDTPVNTVALQRRYRVEPDSETRPGDLATHGTRGRSPPLAVARAVTEGATVALLLRMRPAPLEVLQ